MSLFRCKMCGGNIEFEENATVGTCDSCGTKQTLPKLSDDRRANLYDRANHFRRNNEFDKAMGIYERILSEDNTDAEAYWSLVLCRYGIEYVEDPASHKRVPTVNRAQFTSVFDDDNYRSALQYADGYQRSIYEAEAAAINEIQKGILAISQKEEPFDVFICYKETDSYGRRTPDSVLATDLYHQLTQEGFKVFFARITLEDKLGAAYEPYIFAALNSARVMVVLGTKPEYFNAVWVKNEWSRYLSLVKQSRGKKVLIPAYRDMDPYDLPEEFSHLQAQDMSKLGFMQDLIRGIKKLAQPEAAKATTVIKETVVTGGGNVAPLLERAFLFLEDGDWHSADSYCEKVLDIDPKNAEAYLGKLMAEMKADRREALGDAAQPFDRKNNYQKAIRFGGTELKAELTGYIEHINTRNKIARLDAIYADAQSKLNSSQISAVEAAEKAFASISGWKDADEQRQCCLDKIEKLKAEEEAARQEAARQAEIARKDAIYAGAESKMNSVVISNMESAEQAFASISGYRDADEQRQRCLERIEKLKARKETARRETARQIELSKRKAKWAARRKRPLAALAIVAAVLVVYFKVIRPNGAAALTKAVKYEEIITVLRNQPLIAAAAAVVVLLVIYFTAIRPMKRYNSAVALMKTGKYTEALTAFEAMRGYKDSGVKIVECQVAIKDIAYNNAMSLVEAGKTEEAFEAFEELDRYKDSAENANELMEELIVIHLNKAEVGGIVTFGTYEQSSYKSNDAYSILWRVLAKEGNRMLLISKYALEARPYNTKYTAVAWESCTLRSWLNGEFYNKAFTSAEQAVISTTAVKAHKNPNYSTNPGKDTQDKVFLLSIQELNQYFSSDEARKCVPTEYAISQGAWTSSYTVGAKTTCCWWLRSPGYAEYYAAGVRDDGSVDECGGCVQVDNICVRPALWIDLES